MEANKENQQSIEQAFEQALDAYKAGSFAEAAGQWLALAEDGCAPAQRALGSLYERGQGVEKNAANAFEWTKKRRLSKTIRLLCSIWRATMTRASA